MQRFLREHRRGVVVAALAALAGVVFVLVWFQPHKLFIETTVDETLPVAGPTANETARAEPGRETEPSEDPDPQVLGAGQFQNLEHPTSGTARIVELGDGRRFLRLEGLNTSNGPDLRVYLSEIPASDDWYAYGERFIDLGALKGNRGNQNYEIPARADLSKYKSAVIWCRRFTVGFGVAGLSNPA